MINRTYTLLNNLNEQLHFIDFETDNLVHKSEKALEICIESINKLKKLISKYNFKSQQEEILFFKEIKPQFNSKRIYYNSLSLSKGEATCDLSVKNPNKPEEPHSHRAFNRLKNCFDAITLRDGGYYWHRLFLQRTNL